MISKLRKTDEKCASIVTQFLEEHFYRKHTSNYKIITDKEQQVQGIDSVFTLNEEQFTCDEKAAIRYVNKNLQTFSLELSFKNKNDNISDGWLLDSKKENNSFLFVWIDKGKKDIIQDVNDIQVLEYALVKKNDIITYLDSIGWNLDRLKRKQNYIRNNTDESLGNIYKHKCKFSYSKQLVEEPINILLPRQTLIEIASKSEIIKI